jgi:DNA-binding CsgD family transcriptional regulator
MTSETVPDYTDPLEYPQESAPRHPSSILTPREMKAFALFALGYSTKEVGVRMGVLTRTSSVHRQNIGRKLGIRCVVHLTHYAISSGVIKAMTLEEIHLLNGLPSSVEDPPECQLCGMVCLSSVCPHCGHCGYSQKKLSLDDIEYINGTPVIR